MCQVILNHYEIIHRFLQVVRTKNRPLAKGNISRFDALVFLGGQLGVGCLILLQYNFYTVLLSASSLGKCRQYNFNLTKQNDKT